MLFADLTHIYMHLELGNIQDFQLSLKILEIWSRFLIHPVTITSYILWWRGYDEWNCAVTIHMTSSICSINPQAIRVCRGVPEVFILENLSVIDDVKEQFSLWLIVSTTMF